MASNSNAFTILNPDIAAQQQQIARQQALADSVMQEGNAPINPEQSSGKYLIPISPIQGFTKVAQSLLGAYMHKKADEKNLALARIMQGRMAEAYGGAQSQTQATPWTNPDTGEVMQQPSQAQQSNGIPNGSLAVNGMPPKTAMLAAAMYPEAYGSALMKQYEPTDTMKNYQQAGMSPQAISQAVAGKAMNDATGSYRPGMLIRNPDGSQQIAPDINTGMGGVIDRSGNMQAFAIPGAAFATAAQVNATETAKPKWVTAKDGTQMAIYPAPNPTITQSPSNVFNSTAGIDAPSMATKMAKNVPYLDAQGNPVTPTQETTKDHAQALEQGKYSAEANQAYQKSAATLAGIDATINRMKAINKNVPYGPFNIGEGQAEMSNLPGFDHSKANAAAEWDQLGSQNILQGIKNLGLARMDIPIFKQLEHANGIPRSDNPEARAIMLDNLQRMIHNNVAGAQNAVSALNTPQVPQVETGQIQQYQPNYQPQQSSGPIAKQAPDGKFYIPDPNRPGKYLQQVTQ